MNQKKSKGDPASPFAKLQELKDKLQAEADAKKAATRPAAGKTSASNRSGNSAASSSSNYAAPSSMSSASSSPRGSASRESAPVPAGDLDEPMAFHRLMAGVTPLNDSRRRIPASQASLETTEGHERARVAAAQMLADDESEKVRDHLRHLVDTKTRFEVSDDGRRVEGRRLEVPMDQVRRLRRGQWPIDAHLDLHGLRAHDARESLEEFLRDKRSRGERCVLVVHGKGDHSPGRYGVLRGEIAAWLSQGAASEHVAAFTTAVEDDGGEGAVYVLLRR